MTNSTMAASTLSGLSNFNILTGEVGNPYGFTAEEIQRFHAEIEEEVAEDHAYHDGPNVPDCPLCARYAERDRRFRVLVEARILTMAGFHV